MIELIRELAMYTHESNTTHEFFNLKSTIILSPFQCNHKSTEIKCNILCLWSFFSREGLPSFFHILKEIHKL